MRRAEALAPKELRSLAELAAAAGGRLPARRPDEAVTGVSIDTRTLKPGELFVAVAGPRFDGHDFLAEAAARGAPAAFVDKDVVAPPGLTLIRVEDTTRALAELARHARRAAGVPVVAITGSAGKTTTKEMAAALLATRGPVLKTEGNLNNRYGLPLTLLRLGPEHACAVLELGMSAAGELRHLAGIALPDLAVITNVAPVHLEFFESVDAIAAAKAEILEGLRPGGAAVLNRDDPRLVRVGEGFSGEVVWFGRSRAAEVRASRLRRSVRGTRFELRVPGGSARIALPLNGLHFASNFLAAAAAAHRLGVGVDAIAAVAEKLRASPHRGERLRLGEGVTLLDDCYNSNPAALEAAVDALRALGRGRRVAFLGEMLELGPSGPDLHRQAGRRIAAGLDLLVAVGPLALGFLEGAKQAGLRGRALQALPDSASAAAAAVRLVRPGDTVLVKGSRGVRMEGIVEALQARFGLLEG